MEPQQRVVDNPEELRYEHQGLGNVLVQGALDDLRERGIEYRVVCPFVLAYLRRHPQD